MLWPVAYAHSMCGYRGAVAGGTDTVSGTRGAPGGSTTKPRQNGRSRLTVGAYWSRFGPVIPW